MDATIPTPKADVRLPPILADWMAQRGWHLHAHQTAMLEQAATDRSCLLVAPTGSGKTLAGFLPTLADLARNPREGAHTLYISPLKALAQDIQRNLTGPIEEMGLAVQVGVLTGDTSSHKRAQMRKKFPPIMLTTPESLARLLSYPDSFTQFKGLKTIIIDEIHAFSGTKRGEQLALCLTRLFRIAPGARRVGLSATVSEPGVLAEWLARPGEAASIRRAEDKKPPDVTIMVPAKPLPLGGHFPKHALDELMDLIRTHKTSILFVNTRAFAEMLFQALWERNADGFAIGLHHGSLQREQRQRIEMAMSAGQLRAVVATSALDLGIDWGNVDLVVQIGAPKGISRLLQRIGRSNHRPDLASKAVLVPTNCFEALECAAAISAMEAGQRDDAPPSRDGSLDVLAQHIVNCACAEAFVPDELFHEITQCFPYESLTRAIFDAVLLYVTNGGYALKAYDQYAKLVPNDEGKLAPATARIAQRHRMNIGTIVDSETLKVTRITSKAGGKRRRGGGGVVLGTVEERFVLGLERGDTFMFAGQLLEFLQVREMAVEVQPARGRDPKVPAYAGGKMPLSSHLAQGVRDLLHDGDQLERLPIQVQKWLLQQGARSALPPRDGLLVETFPYGGMHTMVAYPFEGRPAHQALGQLATFRMEHLGLHPVGFLITDYAVAIWGREALTEEAIRAILSPELLHSELEEWLARSALLKRSFRTTAVIAGLIERRLPGAEKRGKQLTVSTDLIYDVLRQYEPGHILLQSTRRDAERDLIDLPRLQDCLHRVQDHLEIKHLPRLSPLSIPVLLERTSNEKVDGGNVAEFLDRFAAMEARGKKLLSEATRAPRAPALPNPDLFGAA